MRARRQPWPKRSLPLRQSFPDLLTILAPRHPERGAPTADLLESHGLSAARRSTGGVITPTTAVYLVDTLGELGLVYRLADIAFVGGSLAPHGGHNPLEPARLDCALLTGPHTENFAEAYTALEGRRCSQPRDGRGHTGRGRQRLARGRDRTSHALGRGPRGCARARRRGRGGARPDPRSPRTLRPRCARRHSGRLSAAGLPPQRSRHSPGSTASVHMGAPPWPGRRRRACR